MNFTFAMAFDEHETPAGLELWIIINRGPEILTPRTANTFEPLRKVEDIDVRLICDDYFIWRNGRKCLGMFQPRGNGKGTLAILLSYPKSQHPDVMVTVHKYLKQNLNYRLLYGAARTDELMARNLRIHQLVNCGAIPPDESLIIENSSLFEVYEQYA